MASWNAFSPDKLKLTPHGILEDMQRIEAFSRGELSKHFKTEHWEAAKYGLQCAANFDFSAAWPVQAHVEFANDLLKRGSFRLPFPNVFMTARDNEFACAVLAQESSVKGFHCFSVIQFGLMKVNEDAFTHPFTVFTIGEKTAGWDYIQNGPPVIASGERLQFDEVHQAVMFTVSLAMGAPALLMSKDIITETVLTPEKLNRQRAKKGRPPIGERHIVRIRPELRKRQGESGEDIRSSPSMHWRRGHFRQIREDFVVPVVPTIVGLSEGARPAIKNYVFSPRTPDDAGSS